MERDARTRNGTSNSLHIDVANCNLCHASHCKLKSCSMHFDKNRTDIKRLHIKEKQSQPPLPRDTGNSPLPTHQERKRNPHKLSPQEVINHTSCTYWSICAKGVNISRRAARAHRQTEECVLSFLVLCSSQFLCDETTVGLLSNDTKHSLGFLLTES